MFRQSPVTSVTLSEAIAATFPLFLGRYLDRVRLPLDIIVLLVVVGVVLGDRLERRRMKLAIESRISFVS